MTDEQYRLSNFKKNNFDNEDQYRISNFIKKPKAKTQEPIENEPTITEDIKQSFLNAPHAVAETIKQLPHEANEAAHMPLKRSLQNIGQGAVDLATLPIGLGNQLINYLVKKHVPYAEKIRSVYPDRPFTDVAGLGEPEPGDALWQSAIPFGSLGRASKGLGGVAGVATRGVGGGLYSTAEGANPIESIIAGTALEGLGHGVSTVPTKVANVGERLKSGVSNTILKKANKGIATGESFTPEQAAQNALQQYTNIEGQPMGADFGTLIGNKNIGDLYNITSKVPFSKGRQQTAMVDKQLFDKKEALARLDHEKQQGSLSKEQKRYEQQLRGSIEELNRHKDILENQIPKLDNEISQTSNIYNQQKNAIDEAPQILNGLRHPEVNHNQLFKNEIETGFTNARNQVNQAYAPFNELDIDLNTLKMPETFESRYRRAYDDFRQESEDLRQLFGDDRDLGNQISNEINKAGSFFEIEQTPPATGLDQQRIGIEPLFRLKRATPEAITTHIRNLQKLAEEAFVSGKRREAAMLNRMASGLKEDMKEILSENGFNEAVSSLEEGDRIFRDEQLPYYKNREITKLATDRDHHLNDTSRVSLAKALHQPSLEPILNNMSQSGRDASLFELITQGKYGRSGHGLTPEQIAGQFHTHLKSNIRQSIENTHPEISNYLENLRPMLDENSQISSQLKELNQNKNNLIKETQGKIKESEKQKTKAEESLPSIAEKLKQSDADFKKALNERFGIAKPKTEGVWKNIKKMLNPLNATSLATGIYFLHSMSTSALAEALGITIPLARKLNKILTETEKVVDKDTGAVTNVPKLLKHYQQGTKVKPNLKTRNELEQKIRMALTYPKKLTHDENKRK